MVSTLAYHQDVYPEIELDRTLYFSRKRKTCYEMLPDLHNSQFFLSEDLAVF